MARPDTPILNKLAEVNDGRSAVTGEPSGQGYLGGLGELPVVSHTPISEMYPRLPEKDTERCYAFKTGAGRFRLVVKSKVDGKKS